MCLVKCFRFPVIYPEKFCRKWVQMRKYLACVVGMPILLRICLSESAYVMQTFLKQITESKKIAAINYPSAVTALY